MATRHVRDTVRQVNENSWLIGDEFIVRRQAFATDDSLWGDDDGYYTVIPAPSSAPVTTTLLSNSHIQQVYDAGDASAVWTFGGAFLKAKRIPDELRNATKEVDTLRWLADHGNFSFAVPKVLYYTEGKETSYLLITRVEGEVLADVWRTIDDDEKMGYASRIVDVCQELSVWRSDEITGIDGSEFPDTWLSADPTTKNLKPQYLQEICKEMGMDCSTFYLWHSDLGPYNVIIDRRNESLGIIDWEMTGYVPLEWIRTKFGVSWAMDFSWPGEDGKALEGWRNCVEKKFADEGYPEVKSAWRERFNEKMVLLRSRLGG